MKLLQFIKDNPNWKEILSNEPYNIHIKNIGTLYMFKYSIDSKWNEITEESRGCILNMSSPGRTAKCCCRPFFKFYNYGEVRASNIDWDTVS